MILKQSLLKFLKTSAIPLLLTAVALRQIGLVYAAGLSPWHGGGFGMFASMDRDERRVVTTRLVGCSLQDFELSKVLADSPEVLRDDTYAHITTFPTEPQLRRLGQRLLSIESQNPIAKSYVQDRANGCDSKLQLQAWRLVYDGNAIAYEPLSDLVEVQL